MDREKAQREFQEHINWCNSQVLSREDLDKIFAEEVKGIGYVDKDGTVVITKDLDEENAVDTDFMKKDPFKKD